MKNISPVTYVAIERCIQKDRKSEKDLLVIEEPLQIKLQYGQGGEWEERILSVTMRTPGHDFDLAIGFLFGEGLIHSQEDIQLIRYCKRVKEEEKGNVLIVTLSPALKFDFSLLERNFLTHSSCGICGKSAIENISCDGQTFKTRLTIGKASLLKQLNQTLMREQTVFKYTGGSHASALHNTSGELLIIREDVGRHNAFDKVGGAA